MKVAVADSLTNLIISFKRFTKAWRFLLVVVTLGILRHVELKVGVIVCVTGMEVVAEGLPMHL